MSFVKRIQEFNAASLCIACIALALVVLLCPDAYAVSLAACAQNSGFKPEALTGPIVYCIQTTVEQTVGSSLTQLSKYFRDTTTAIMILAVTMHGAHMLSGERGINGKSLVLLLKIGFVGYFSYNMGWIAGKIFEIMDELLSYCVCATDQWTVIDNILGTIFGFAPGIAIFQGLMWLGMAMTNGTTSAGMSAALIVAFIEIILFVIEIVYVYLSSYVVVAFMLILSPMFIPMIIFQISERYFRKWMDVIIGAMLIPFLVWSALCFSLNLYGTLICNVMTIILPNYNCEFPTNPNKPPDFSAFWKLNQAQSSMTMGVDSNLPNDINDLAMSNAPGALKDRLGAHTFINPFNRGGFDMSTMHPPGVDFGKHDKTITRKLMFALISLWIYTMILKQLIEAMPEVAQEIAGVMIGISLRGPKLTEKISELKNDVAGGLGVSAGAIAGGRLGAATGSTRASEASAIAGGIIGDVLARKIV